MRADRLLSMMLLLHANKRMTAQDLAEQLEVSERTIYRDIDALSIAGVPVYTQSGPNGGIFLDEHYRISLTGLSQDQVMSLFASTEAGPLEDIGMARAVEDSLLKLFAALPISQQRDVEKMRQRIHIDPMGWFQSGETSAYLDLLQQAVWQDQQITMTYQTVEGDTYPVTLDAYALVSKGNVWYLIGRREDGAYRSYRLSRIYALELLDTYFERDPDFNLVNYWQTSRQQFKQHMAEQFKLYPATISVHPDMFWYFGSFLEGRFKQVGEPDERGWIPVEVTFGSQEEAYMHVIGLGTLGWVVEPEELREGAVARAKALIQHHETTLGT